MTRLRAARTDSDRNRRRLYSARAAAARGRRRHGNSASRDHRLQSRENIVVDSTPRIEIDRRVRSLPSDEIIQRFHCLVDKRLQSTLRFIESFELDCIEARLDAEEQAELSGGVDSQSDWIRERSQLIESIERLLATVSAR
jgi:hypothetical protein